MCCAGLKWLFKCPTVVVVVHDSTTLHSFLLRSYGRRRLSGACSGPFLLDIISFRRFNYLFISSCAVFFFFLVGVILSSKLIWVIARRGLFGGEKEKGQR